MKKVGGDKDTNRPLYALAVACVIAASLSGCGAFKVKAGPLSAGAGLEAGSVGVNIGVENDGKPLAGFDLAVSANGIIQLITGLFDKN